MIILNSNVEVMEVMKVFKEIGIEVIGKMEKMPEKHVATRT